MGSADGASAEAGKAGAGPMSGGETRPRAIMAEVIVSQRLIVSSA